MTKKNSMVVALVMEMHYEDLNIVVLVMELHHGSYGVMKLVLKPHHMDSCTRINQ